MIALRTALMVMPGLALAMTLLCGSASEVDAATSAWVGDGHAAVRLITAVDVVSPATPIEAGLEFRYAPGWHGYWRTPGDTGVPPVIDWSGTEGLAAATVSWPAPHRLVIDRLQNSVYEGRVVLPLRLSLAPRRGAAHGAPIDMQAEVDYAACSNVCVPFHADLALSLATGAIKASGEAPDIAAARAAVPRPPRDAGIAVVEQSVSGSGADRKLVLSLRSDTVAFEHPDVIVEGAGAGIPPAPAVQLDDGGRTATFTIDLGDAGTGAGAAAPTTLTLVDGSRSVEFTGPALAPISGSGAIWPALVSALLGGLVLNLMPCVLPVLSIKLVGLTQRSDAGRRTVRVGFLVTALGIVTSFMLLAIALVGLKWSGASLGWGIQFQQPLFLAAMAALTVTFAANLFDWIHIGVPRAALDLSGIESTARPGSRARWVEPFFSGAFATLLATPCSAPFVGTAVGFALAGSAFDILAIFSCLGIGMALPFICAVLVPGVAGWLPRPGPWMVALRRVLGLLLIATAAWLLAVLWSVAGGLGSVATGLLLAGMLAVLWIGASRDRSGRRWPVRAAGAMGLLAIVAAGLLPDVRAVENARPDDAVAFDLAAIEELVAEGKTVLVDVSASWCLTCKVNELAALRTAEVRARLMRPGTILMRADWSRPDPVVARYIQSFGRFGIPLDVVYGPRSPAGEPLSELLTPRIVIAALDRVAAEGERALGDPGDRESTP